MSELSCMAAGKARSHAARMSHTAQVRPPWRPGAICDIRRRRIAPTGSEVDLTFPGIAGSMDDHADNEDGEVFGL